MFIHEIIIVKHESQTDYGQKISLQTVVVYG